MMYRQIAHACMAALLLTGAVAGAAERTPHCGPAVTVEGEPDLVLAIAATLLRRGIGTAIQPGCPVVRVYIERRGPALGVVILEEIHHADRLAAGPDSAATIIESWARNDISAPLLLGRPIPAPPPPSPPPPPQPKPLLHPLPPKPAPARGDRFTVGALFEGAWGSDQAAWLSASVRGCARVGPLCVGGLLRFLWDVPPRQVSGYTTVYTIQHMGTDALFMVELPLRVRWLLLSPGVGVGAGWLRTQVDSGLALGDGGLRGEVHLIAGVPLPHGLSLDLGVFLGGAVLDSGNSLPGREHEAEVPLPAPPWGFLRGGVGLSWRSF